MPEKENKSAGVAAQVAERIQGSDNVLVALSKNPSVDDLSAALGLTFILDKMGKHATAIFSGAVPNAIEFLEPEKTFEANTNSLRDFIIALDKEKADHLRYKIEGDYVKVFITPYKTTLSESDLEFSHGDFNVDLVIALNVSSEADLDSALTEYGRIKHDASSINITAGAPGKFGDLEWGDPGASSVSEMIAHLSTLLDKNGEGKLVEKSTATALLAGIVAATKRFSNDRTSAETMAVASDLMSAGADQQLISSSIPTDVLNQKTVDVNSEVEAVEAEAAEAPAEETPEVPVEPKDDTEIVIEREPQPAAAESAVEAPVEPAPEAVAAPEAPVEPIVEAPIEEPAPQIIPQKPAEAISEPKPEEASPVAPTIEAHAPTPIGEVDYSAEMAAELEQAEAAPAVAPAPDQYPTAAELPSVEIPVAPTPESQAPVDAVPVVAAPVVNEVIDTPTTPPTNVAPFQPPVADPTVPPVDNSQAEYVAPPFPMPGEGDILPPPPAPFTMDDVPAAAPAAVEPLPSAVSATASEPIMPAPVVTPAAPVAPAPAPAPTPNPDLLPGEVPSTPIQPATPPDYSSVVGPTASSPSVNGVNPVMQDQIYNDPSAFKIPGM
ncbi:hypothetical protein IKH79_03645 [Candidatus Saccharibacteria bacterium]|nr:hypothetical protein [Candidatus Saccharibacteria bacterium]